MRPIGYWQSEPDPELIIMDDYERPERPSPSERRRRRILAYYSEEIEKRVRAEYEATRYEGEPYGAWAMRKMNERRSAILDATYKPTSAPNVIIRRT